MNAEVITRKRVENGEMLDIEVWQTKKSGRKSADKLIL